MPNRPPLPTLVLAEDLGHTPNSPPLSDIQVSWFSGPVAQPAVRERIDLATTTVPSPRRPWVSVDR